MERRGFIGTIMGAVSAVLVPIPVGKNMLADYAEPVKHTEDLNEVFAQYVGTNCSGTIAPTTQSLSACSGSFLSYKYKDMWNGYGRT